MDALLQFKAELLERLDWDFSRLGTAVSIEEMKTHGTTIGAMIVDDGRAVVAFSDGKMSVMDQAWCKDADKVIQTDSHTCFLISGSAVLGVEMAKALGSLVASIQNSQQFTLTARARVNFVTEMLKQIRGAASHGMGVEPILATYDVANTQQGKVFMFTQDGMWLDKKVFVYGSGHHSGHGPLVQDYTREVEAREVVSLARGIELARQTLETTKEEDNASGGKQTIKIIDASGVRLIEEA